MRLYFEIKQTIQPFRSNDNFLIINNNNLKQSIMKTRKEAAIELNVIYNNYEVRQNSLKTTYNKIFKDGDNWRLIGHAHDYTV